MIHDSMPCDPSQGQGHGGLKCAKMTDFERCIVCQYARNQNTNGELWYSKTMSKFNWTDFLIFVLVQRHVIFKLRLLITFDKRIFASNNEYWTSSPVWGLYITNC